MRKLISLLLVLVFAASVACAQDASAPLTLQGTVIDLKCAAAKDAQQLAEFTKTHAKDCALACASSGYAILADGVLAKFDKDSSAKVEEFLKKADSKLQVIVEVKKTGEELALVSIKNQG